MAVELAVHLDWQFWQNPVEWPGDGPTRFVPASRAVPP